MKKLMGSLSPAYGLMSGEGAFGKIADAGLGGIIPSALADRRRRKKKDGTDVTAAEAAQGMKKGGSVRGDGCATKGKTKGRMV